MREAGGGRRKARRGNVDPCGIQTTTELLPPPASRLRLQEQIQLGFGIAPQLGIVERLREARGLDTIRGVVARIVHQCRDRKELQLAISVVRGFAQNVQLPALALGIEPLIVGFGSERYGHPIVKPAVPIVSIFDDDCAGPDFIAIGSAVPAIPESRHREWSSLTMVNEMRSLVPLLADPFDYSVDHNQTTLAAPRLLKGRH